MNDPAAAPPPEPDRLPGVPHPRHTRTLYGHESAERAFVNACIGGRMHHAWLLSGPAGIGKATLAWKIARFVLAQPGQPGQSAEESPHTPNSLEIAPQHPVNRRLENLCEPGFMLIRRPWDDKGKRLKTEITVEEVRRLQGFFHLSQTAGGRRVALVDAADDMNTAAANALLKILEEPPAGAVFLLVAHRPARLLATLRSRCRTLPMRPLGEGDLDAALKQAGLAQATTPALKALAHGSVGTAARLSQGGGDALYTQLVGLWKEGGFNRAKAAEIANGMGRAAGQGQARLDMFFDLVAHFLARLTRAGVSGPPTPEAAAGEAGVLARLCPDTATARTWAHMATTQLARGRRGAAVNLDPGALVLDTLAAIDAQVRHVGHAAHAARAPHAAHTPRPERASHNNHGTHASDGNQATHASHNNHGPAR